MSLRQIVAGVTVGKAEELDHVVKPEELVGESEAKMECVDGVGLLEGMTGVVKRGYGL